MYINKNAILNRTRKTMVQQREKYILSLLLHTFSRHSNKVSINFPPCVLNGDNTKSVSFLTSWLKYL